MLAIGSWDLWVFFSVCIYMAKANHTSPEFNQRKTVKNVWTFYKGLSIAWYCSSEREMNFSFSTQKIYVTEYFSSSWIAILPFQSPLHVFLYLLILSFYRFLFSFFFFLFFIFMQINWKKKESSKAREINLNRKNGIFCHMVWLARLCAERLCRKINQLPFPITLFWWLRAMQQGEGCWGVTTTVIFQSYFCI